MRKRIHSSKSGIKYRISLSLEYQYHAWRFHFSFTAILCITPPTWEATHSYRRSFNCNSFYTLWLIINFYIILIFYSLSISAPFDWRTPFGYMVLFCLHILIYYYIALWCTCFVNLILGKLYFMCAFTDDLQAEISIFNDLNKKECGALELYEKLCNIIRFHSNVKQ